MTTKRKVSKPVDPARALVKAIAMDIGKAVAHHIEYGYSEALKATSRNMLLSVRNTVYNEIMAAIAVTDETEILARLKERRAHRRKLSAISKKNRKPRK